MIYELVLQNFDCSHEFVFVSAVTSDFQVFTYKLCLQFSGLRMRNFTWNRFPIKNLLIESFLSPIMESTYLNSDMCKFESLQKDESRWQSTDSLKAYRNTSALKCSWILHFSYFCWAWVLSDCSRFVHCNMSKWSYKTCLKLHLKSMLLTTQVLSFSAFKIKTALDLCGKIPFP